MTKFPSLQLSTSAIIAFIAFIAGFGLKFLLIALYFILYVIYHSVGSVKIYCVNLR